MRARFRFARHGAAALCAIALACGASPAAAQTAAEPASALRYTMAVREASRQVLQGDPGRAVMLYHAALAEVDKGLPLDKANRNWLLAGLMEAYQRAGRSGDAIAFLESIGSHPALDGPWRSYLCRLTLKQHALDKAEAACLAAVAEEDARSAAVTPAQAALGARVLAIRQSLMEISTAVPDASSVVFRQADQGGNTAFSKPEESFLRTLSPHALLAQLYFERHDLAALAAFHDGGFAHYAEQIEGQLKDAQPAAGFVPLEDEHAGIGALLAGLDPSSPQATRALREALRLNAARTRFIASQYNPALLAGTLASRRAKAALYATIVLRQPNPDQALLASMAGEMMQAKGVLSELLAIRHRHIATSGDARLQALYNEAETAAAAGEEARWKAAALQLDALNPAWLPATLFEEGARHTARVAARLGGRTLVSVLRYSPFDLGSQAFGEPHYLALRLGGGEVSARDLGPADAIDLMVQRYRGELAAMPGPAAAPRARELGRALYAKLLAPVLGERLPDGDYLADLDGMLNLLPLEALVDASGRYLVEAAPWRYLSSTRALLRESAAPPAAAGNTALLLVDPAFSMLPARQGGEAPAPGAEALRAAAADALGRFAPLPETRAEGSAVARALSRMGTRVSLLSGTRAAPAALSALSHPTPPRFLHIATHGFYLDDQPPGPAGLKSSAAASGGMAGGIALAGANLARAGQRGAGLFFTSQFRTLDLGGTELVVMSACDTGVGSVRAGEGLTSLRQGLELAGARAQVTALWKVPSAATTRLMARFYDNLAAGAPKAQALRQAKLALLRTEPNPLYWAGFTFAGDD